jgi:hypothetical protein
MRSANRKALKPQPTHQAKLVVWHLMYRVPLYWVAIPDTEIAKACERFNLPLETWLRQEKAFGLLKKVYSRRAQLRGQQPLNAPVANPEQKNAAPTEDDKSGVASPQPDPLYQRMQSIGRAETWAGLPGPEPEREPEQPDRDDFPSVGL